MVVMRERKNRTRILCQEISRDFLNGKTTSLSGCLDGIFFEDERDKFFTRDPFPFLPPAARRNGTTQSTDRTKGLFSPGIEHIGFLKDILT
jgi:hypothetical protein